MRYQYYFGKKFYLDNKTGYWISTTSPRIRAHRWVWESFNGKIPEGFHVHHKDGDKSNNLIDNLMLMSRKDHLRLHMSLPERSAFSRQLVGKIRHLTKKWHSSEPGISWHREHGKRCWEERKEFELFCKMCSVKFKTKTYHQDFCSNKCKSSWRRKERLDDIEIKCEWCSQSFMRNKYAKGRFCSKSCSLKSSWGEGKMHKKGRK